MVNCRKQSKSYLRIYSDYSVLNYTELIKSNPSSIPLPALERRRKIFLHGHGFPVYHRPSHTWLHPALSKYLLSALWQTLRKASLLPLRGCDLSREERSARISYQLAEGEQQLLLQSSLGSEEARKAFWEGATLPWRHLGEAILPPEEEAPA